MSKGCGVKFDGWHYCGETIQGMERPIYCSECDNKKEVGEARFTKGDWRYSHAKGQAKKYVMCDGLRIATVPINSGKTDAKANAHLISAAPEMYKMLDTIETVLSGNSEYNATEINVDYLRRLLAKARGEK